jgi:hypothetical protein
MESHPIANASQLAHLRWAVRRREFARRCFRSLRSVPLSMLLVLAVSAIAHARTETLRWEHPNPSQVAGYYVHYGAISGNYTTHINVALPPVNSDGTYSYDVEVPDDEEVYVAVTAYDALSQESAYSNEQQRLPQPPPAGPEPLGRPGRPELIVR